MKIVNSKGTDYHIHSLNGSDGNSTYEEIVKFACQQELTEIAITDHSQASIEFYRKKGINLGRGFRNTLATWRNIQGSTKVIFGVEADILNEDGDICDHIQGKQGDFIILSLHEKIYEDNNKSPHKKTEAYVKAIERHHEIIKVIGHPCLTMNHPADIVKIVETANKYGIPLEINGANLFKKDTDLSKLSQMLKLANKIMINSDSHTLSMMIDGPKIAYDFLKQEGYLKTE
jgi:HisJ family histidinol phosphate phosphatase